MRLKLWWSIAAYQQHIGCVTARAGATARQRVDLIECVFLGIKGSRQSSYSTFRAGYHFTDGFKQLVIFKNLSLTEPYKEGWLAYRFFVKNFDWAGGIERGVETANGPDFSPGGEGWDRGIREQVAKLGTILAVLAIAGIENLFEIIGGPH